MLEPALNPFRQPAALDEAVAYARPGERTHHFPMWRNGFVFGFNFAEVSRGPPSGAILHPSDSEESCESADLGSELEVENEDDERDSWFPAVD